MPSWSRPLSPRASLHLLEAAAHHDGHLPPPRRREERQQSIAVLPPPSTTDAAADLVDMAERDAGTASRWPI